MVNSAIAGRLESGDVRDPREGSENRSEILAFFCGGVDLPQKNRDPDRFFAVAFCFRITRHNFDLQSPVRMVMPLVESPALIGPLAVGGLLPARGSFMLDFVFLATFLIVLALAVSIYLVKAKRAYTLHGRLQVVLFAVLVVAVAAFEIELQFFTKWRELAQPSPYYASGWVDRILAVHLCFSIPTPLLWLATVVLGLRWFGWSAIPNRHSRKHRVLGWISTVFMVLTTSTGWLFYYLAFMAV